jgi:hypothetical protein
MLRLKTRDHPCLQYLIKQDWHNKVDEYSLKNETSHITATTPQLRSLAPNVHSPRIFDSVQNMTEKLSRQKKHNSHSKAKADTTQRIG